MNSSGRLFPGPLSSAMTVLIKTNLQASDYRQRSLDNIESASEILKGEKNTEERAKAQARRPTQRAM